MIENEPKRRLSEAQLRQRREAALSHGLRAQAKQNLRSRSLRTAGLATRAFKLCYWLRQEDVPSVRRWAQLEVMATDTFAAWEQDPDNGKLADMFLATTRAQLPWARELGFTPAVRASMGLERAPLDLVAMIDAERPS